MRGFGAGEIVSLAALLILGGLGAGALFQPIPAANATSFATIVGALAGALTVAGGQKVAERLSAGGGGAADAPEAGR